MKRCAASIDRTLNECPWQTLVHGDAKLANFCFSTDRSAVAAVDFQYVGGGCGMKDLAYLISSCLDEHDCEAYETALLDTYFDALTKALHRRNHAITHTDIDAIIDCWRPLYPVAWTDFFRFLQGWSPNHWKIHAYSERLAQETIAQYDSK